MSTADIESLQREVDRAIREVREAIGALAQQRKAVSWIIRVSTLLDKIECHVIAEDGESAFTLDEQAGKVCFRASTLARVWNAMHDFAGEVDPEADLLREKQLGLNQFIIHELLHIRQNFPHFGTVQKIKKGLPGYGLPLLDIAADIASASITASIELYRNRGKRSDFNRYYLNAIIRAYIIGTLVFDAASKPEKRQRAIGLMMSAALVYASIEGNLNADRIFEDWSNDKPIMSMNLEAGECFNGFVLSEAPGLLLKDHNNFSQEELLDVWNLVGKRPISRMLKRVIKLLAAGGAIDL